jgi:hypothetical protein
VPGADNPAPVERDEPADREDPIGGSVPGADELEPVERDEFVARELPIGGSFPGADDGDGCVECDDRVACDDALEFELPIGGSFPGADDGDGCVECDDRAATTVEDCFDPVFPLAARLYEAPAPIRATVARAANGRCVLLMFDSFVWLLP